MVLAPPAADGNGAGPSEANLASDEEEGSEEDEGSDEEDL